MSINRILQPPIDPTPGVGFIDAIAKAAIVRPKGQPGISGFLFDIPETEKLTLTADITDNYTEDNTYINDNRVFKPVTIELSGLIGELVLRQTLFSQIAQAASLTLLATVAAFQGNFTDGMTQVLLQGISAANYAVSSVNRVKEYVSKYTTENGPFATSQEAIFAQLEALFVTQKTLTVQTPWKFYDNMLIQSIEANQSPESTEISDIKVSLKQVRFAKIGIQNFSELGDVEARTLIQQQGPDNTGPAGTALGSNDTVFKAAVNLVR